MKDIDVIRKLIIDVYQSIQGSNISLEDLTRVNVRQGDLYGILKSCLKLREKRWPIYHIKPEDLRTAKTDDIYEFLKSNLALKTKRDGNIHQYTCEQCSEIKVSNNLIVIRRWESDLERDYCFDEECFFRICGEAANLIYKENR